MKNLLSNKHRVLMAAAAALLGTISSGPCAVAANNDALKKYISAPDDSYEFGLVEEGRSGACKVYIYKLSSQTWQGIKWWHWLSVLVPDKIHSSDKGVLVIAGGSNREEKPPGAESKEARLFSMLASQTGAVTAILEQVPNQPLYGGLYEDDLIAHTYVKFLDGGKSDWPLLLPMVKSAVRAMDTLETVSEKQFGHKLGRFIVTGASKRGWTTWLTGAADKRVCAIAPMVIDMLNTNPQMDQQLRTYGKFSEQIEPYTKRHVQERMNTNRGRELIDIVDPYSYRGTLTMPKLMLLGTNDPYWTVDAANLYFDGLEGSRHLIYVPNAGHGLGGGLPVIPTLSKFFTSAMDDKTLPNLDWKWSDTGDIQVEWEQSGGKAMLWHAHSDDRDFRKAKWTSTPMAVDGNKCGTQVKAPAEGWDAWYVQVDFPDKAAMWSSYNLSTQIKVLPESFPHERKK